MKETLRAEPASEPPETEDGWYEEMRTVARTFRETARECTTYVPPSQWQIAWRRAQKTHTESDLARRRRTRNRCRVPRRSGGTRRRSTARDTHRRGTLSALRDRARSVAGTLVAQGYRERGFLGHRSGTGASPPRTWSTRQWTAWGSVWGRFRTRPERDRLARSRGDDDGESRLRRRKARRTRSRRHGGWELAH